MAEVSDAVVFFGATGDLAYKQIFPALQAMVQRGHLNMPVIGVATPDWTLDQFRACARVISRHTSRDRSSVSAPAVISGVTTVIARLQTARPASIAPSATSTTAAASAEPLVQSQVQPENNDKKNWL